MVLPWSLKNSCEELLPHVSRTGLPLLVHAELPGPINRATDALADADWNCYSTYVQSRPDEAEVAAIRMLLSLCREYNFRLHIVHLSTCHALEELRAARSEGLSVSVETCPHYLHLAAETIANGATPSKCAPPIRSRENCEKIVAGTPRGDDRPCGDRPFTMSSRDEAAARRQFPNRVGWYCKLVSRAAADVDRSQQARISHCSISHAGCSSAGSTGWL